MDTRQPPKVEMLPSARLGTLWAGGKPVRWVLWLVGFGAILYGLPMFGGAVLLTLPLASVVVHVYLGHMSGREIQRQMIEAEQRRRARAGSAV